MQKLEEVELAKSLMKEAEHWSVLKWLTEKKKVRKAADKAHAAHDKQEAEVKALWSDELKAAYAEIVGKESKLHREHKATALVDPQLRLIAKRIKEADDEAYRVRMDAEDTFDKAEKIMSTSLAREGTRKAIACWELREKAIHKAEAAIADTKESKSIR